MELFSFSRFCHVVLSKGKMERVFKIKTRAEPDLSNQYPSERRYSASIVLGLTAVFIQLCCFSILMGSLVIHKIYVMDNLQNTTNVTRLAEKIARDLEYSSNRSYIHYYINIPAVIVGGCFVMAMGDFMAFVAGLLAWKRWYIDHNIAFFFVTCCASTLTSSVAFVISMVTTFNIEFVHLDAPGVSVGDISPVSIGLAVNIIILSLLNTAWSAISGKVAYNGMRSRYPDDIVDRRGQVRVVRTTRRGNCGAISTIPAELINYAALGTMVKYLPKVENQHLPKEESSAEYQQRVDQFLNSDHSEIDQMDD